MKIGIDKIGFYVPKYYIDMRELAHERGVDPDKFTIGLGQDEMAVNSITQDTITLAANAAYNTIDDEDLNDIDLVILATESGIDYSKAGATSIHALLGINKNARCIELKQACYSATAALQFAKGHIALNPNKKALVIASDISRYGLHSSGEPTQGAGSVAMLITQDPNILNITNESTYYTDDVWDFWRPNYKDAAVVDGKYSNEQYLRLFNETFTQFKETYNQDENDLDAMLFHIPYTKLGRKTLNSIVDNDHQLMKIFNKSTTYNRKVGNIYTGSLYLSLISMLYKAGLPGNSKIGLYSYGSGAVAEFFTMELVESYQEHLNFNPDAELNKRRKVTIAEYEKMFNAKLVDDGTHQILETDGEVFQLKELKNHRRYYLSNK